MQIEHNGPAHVAPGVEDLHGAELDALLSRVKNDPNRRAASGVAFTPEALALASWYRIHDRPAFDAFNSALPEIMGTMVLRWRSAVTRTPPARIVPTLAPLPREEPANDPAMDLGAVEPSTGAGQPEPAGASATALDALDDPRPYTCARFDDPDDESPEAEAERDRQWAELEESEAQSRAKGRERVRGILEGRDRKAARMTPTRGPGGLDSLGVPRFVAGVLHAIAEGREPDAGELTRALEALTPGASPERETASPDARMVAPAHVEPAPVSWAAGLGIVECTGADAAADAREAMRAASREGAPDPLDGLAERITREGNPALAFDALAIGAALDLRADDGPAFQSLRGALKRAGVTITEWSRALDVEGQRRKRAAKEAERAAMHRAALLRREGEEAERAATAEKLKAVRGERPELAAHYNQETSNGATFTMEPGRVMMDSPTAQGPKRTTLANFSAPIVAHTLELDAPDARPRGTYTLSVVLEGSETPREVDVEAERFARMEWVETALGPRAVVAPGKGARDNLRAALGYLSSPVTRQRCGFTGWIRHEGRWVYLHAGGAIGEGGAVEGLAATPPAPVDRFALPAPPVGSELARAVGAVVELLSMDPAAVTVPMVALAFHAPLGGSRCAVHVNGPAERGKSVRASLVQRLFGASMEPREGLPVSWADGSTSIGIGSVLARAGDALVVIDDLKLSGGARDESDAVRVDRVFRTHFNGAGALKGRREGGAARVDPPSRCDVLSTGETLPKGSTASTLNRVVTVELDAPLPANIGELDALASGGVLAAGMAAYLRWLAPQVEDLRPRARAEERAASTRWGFSEKSRATELLGGLCLGMEYLLRFLAASGVSAADVERHRARALAALHDVAGEHGARVADEGIAPRFLGLVAQALRSGFGHVAEVRRSEVPGGELRLFTPADAHLWGYQRRGAEWVPTGPTIGYLMRSAPPSKPSGLEDAVCLLPAPALALARRVERDNGRALGADAHAVGAALNAAGALARTDLATARPRTTTRVRTTGRTGPTLDVWAVKLSALGYGADDEPDEGGAPEATAPADDGTGPAPEFPADVDPFAR